MLPEWPEDREYRGLKTPNNDSLYYLRGRAPAFLRSLP